MATLETILVQRVQATTGITNLIGNRFYPIRLPQNVVLPAVTFQRISTPGYIYSHAGFSGLISTRFQFRIVSKSVVEANAIMHALTTFVHNLRGIFDNVHISNATVANRLEQYDAEPQLYAQLLDVWFFYAER